MASVDWQKATTQCAGAMKKHNGREERVNGNHSNKHIDKSKSHLNVYIGADDYAPMLDKVKARIKEVDRLHPPKRNMGDKRVTCILLETPVPQEITEQGRAEEFLLKAHQVIERCFGAENVGGTCGHLDEQHYYIDKDGKERLSLVHGHTICAAYAEWVDKRTGEFRQGINGKNCETKARLRELNKAMSEMCMQEFGIEFNTAETPERKSVETLKQESEIRQELTELNKRVGELQRAEEESRDKFLEADERATEAEIRASTAENRAESAEKRAEVAEKRTATAENKLKEVNAQYDIANKDLKKTLDMKARAAKVPSLNPFSETVSVHRNTWDGIKEIGNEAYDRLDKANQIKQEAIAIQQKAERMEQAIEPLYREANNDRVIASQERQRAEQLVAQQEKLIDEQAKKKATELIAQIMQGQPTSESERMRKYMNTIELESGLTALEAFETMEKLLKQKLTRGLERSL